MSDEIERYIRDRNVALLSMDEQTIRTFMSTYSGNPGPADSETFWRGIHKARTGCLDLPIEERRKSKAWLDARNSSSFDDGDL